MQKSGLHRVGSGRSQRHSNLIGSTTYDGKIAGLYDLEETLGRGHFAVVKLARHVFTGEKVAVKVIDKTKLDEISRAHLFQEVRCMKLVQHPNVVRLYEVIDTQTKLYLILELADGGDLYDYIMRHENGLDEESARHYFRQVVQAISYCHQLHVVHRDLKPENVVFFEKLGMVKLTDFGFSNKYNPGQKLETSCGSLAYSAPEILLGDSYDAPAVDIWSLGVILYMLVCGHPPFQEANDSETLTMIMDCKYTIPSHVSEPCRRLIASMLQRDPAKRSTLQDIANDLWLQDGNTLQPSDYLPLVSREHLTEEDHALILQKMVNGKIATKEEIIEALDKNEYNNITATYFLLAERKLRTQRQERAQMVTRGQRPEAPKPEQQTKPLAAEETVEVSKPETRVRKFSIVEEEEEIATASGSESSRRTSNNSLTSQRTSNTSLASQRTSNNSLAGSLRSRGLLTNPPTTRLNIIGQRSTDLRLDLQQGVVRKPPPVKITPEEKTPETVKTAEPPAPFPTTCGIGLGLRSPLTSPGSVNKAAASPSSVSPGTPSTPSSPSPASSNITSPQGSSKRTLPSPSRVLHAVRSSPQLVLNEIFEEAESGSDSEATFGDKPVHVFVSSSTSSRRTSPRASSVGPSVFTVRSSGSSTSPPNLVRRYEQRRQMAKNRTASCSSSDASDDDNESRKKRAGKIKPFPRRDSHDDSSDPGGDGPGGPDGGGEGVAGGNGTSSVSLIPSSVSRVTRGESSSSTGNSSNTPTSSNRSYLQPSICRTQDLRTRSKYRLLGGGKPRHSVDSSYALLSPNMGSETHLRASQSLSCLPEVCEAPEGSAVAVLESSLTAAIPALSCTNLGRLNEGDSFPSPEASRKQDRPQTAETESNSPESSWLGDESTPTETSPNGASCSSNPVEVRKLKKVKHFFSRREHDPSRSSHKRLVRRLRAKNTGTKNSSSTSEELDSDSRLHRQGAEASEAKEEKGRALSFFRSRLYKARSLGSLVKERIMVEASNCQNELWRRLGRSADVNQNRSSSALPGSHGTKKIFPFAQKARNSTPPVVVEEFVDAPPAHPSMNQIVGGVSTHCSPC